MHQPKCLPKLMPKIGERTWCTPATGVDRGMPALENARVALLTAVMAAAPSSASTSLVSRIAKGNTLPRGTTPAFKASPSDMLQKIIQDRSTCMSWRDSGSRQDRHRCDPTQCPGCVTRLSTGLACSLERAIRRSRAPSTSTFLVCPWRAFICTPHAST